MRALGELMPGAVGPAQPGRADPGVNDQGRRPAPAAEDAFFVSHHVETGRLARSRGANFRRDLEQDDTAPLQAARHAAAGSSPRFRTAVGTMTFLAALHHNWTMDAASTASPARMRQLLIRWMDTSNLDRELLELRKRTTFVARARQEQGTATGCSRHFRQFRSALLKVTTGAIHAPAGDPRCNARFG